MSSGPLQLRLDSRQVLQPHSRSTVPRWRSPHQAEGTRCVKWLSWGAQCPHGACWSALGGGLDFEQPFNPVPLRPGLFLGSVAQCVAWLWARAASQPASASLPPLRPKTKLGHGQTLHALCLSLHHSPPFSGLFFSIIGGHCVPFSFCFFLHHTSNLFSMYLVYFLCFPFISFCYTLQIHVMFVFNLLVLFILPSHSTWTAPNLSSVSRVSHTSFQKYTHMHTHKVIVCFICTHTQAHRQTEPPPLTHTQTPTYTGLQVSAIQLCMGSQTHSTTQLSTQFTFTHIQSLLKPHTQMCYCSFPM